MKPEEQRVLGILATIFGTIALLGSWIPFINYPSLFIGIVAFILGIIGLIVNLKKRKKMAIIGTSLAVASVVLFFTSQVLYADVYKEYAKEFNRSYMGSSMEREEKSGLTDDTSAQTQEQFDALIEGDLDNKGKGGTNYEDIINKHGKPDSEFDFTLGGYDTKKITYISIGDKIKTVTLTFAKDDNGELLLVQKHQSIQVQKKASNKTIPKPESKFKYQKNEQLVKLFVFLLESVYVCVDLLYVFVVFKNAVQFFKGFKVIA